MARAQNFALRTFQLKTPNVQIQIKSPAVLIYATLT